MQLAILVLTIAFGSLDPILGEPIPGTVGVEPKVPKVFDYGDYVAKYDKNYGPVETMDKAKLFYSRTVQIFKHNILFASKGKDYYLKQNEFTDLPPEKLKKSRVISDLKPVVGADKYPDMPADASLRLLEAAKAIEIESESQSSTKNLQNPKLVKLEELVVEKPGEAIFNPFVDKPQIEDPRKLIEMLNDHPELTKRMAKLASLSVSPASAINENQLEKIRKKNNVDLKQVVKSSNPNYDPLMTPSYGTKDSIRGGSIAKDNFAKYLMDGLDFDYNIAPYPTPAPIPELENENPFEFAAPILSISSLFSSVTSMLEVMSKDLDSEELNEGVYIEPQVEEKLPEISYQVDWRQSGCITTPKSQQDCDSCYAFAVLSLMEFFHCKQTKTLTDFSPQYIVDCGAKKSLRGCKGGKISNVGLFIKEYGIELSSTYPYLARENECIYDRASDEKKKDGYLRPEITHWHGFNEIKAWYKWLPRSPLVVGINMPADFHAYGGGIHDGLDCLTDMTHAMLLVGSGVQDGKKFWLLKNSYSDSWGEAGYFRLSHSAPLRCFQSVFVIRANFAESSS